MSKSLLPLHRLQYLLSLSIIVGWTPAHADLADTAGLSEIQKNSAVAIQTVCINLPTLSTRNSKQQDLLDRCRNMRQTAGTLGFGSPGAPAFPYSLQVDAKTLGTIIQAAAPEELAARQKLAVEGASKNQSSALRGRLSALRAGAKGLSLSGLNLNIDGKTSLAEQLLRSKQRGGAAGSDGDNGRLGTFINGNYNTGDKQTTDREDGFDFDNLGVTGGVDYRFTDSLVAGLALSYDTAKSAFVNSLGDVKSSNIGLSVYGSYYIQDFYLDGHFSYSRNDYDSTRNIFIPNNNPGNKSPPPASIRSAKGSSKANQFALGIGGGYDVHLGRTTITPYGRVDYIDLDLGAFDESGAQGLDLHVDGQKVKSLQSAVGGLVSYAISTGFGVLVPQAGVEWNHEYKNESKSASARFVNDPFNTTFFIPSDNPDRNYFTVSLGLSALFKNGLSAFANYETVQGLDKIKNQGVTLGLRKEW